MTEQGCRIPRRRRSLTATIITLVTVAVAGACGRSGPEPAYVPLPTRDLAVVQSEVQAFMVDTILPELVRPYSMEFLPDRSILITERRGHLLVVRDGQIVERIEGGNVPLELRDVVLHPDYEENGWIYLTHYVDPTDTTPARTVVSRARLEAGRLIDLEEIYSAGPFRGNGGWFGSRIAFDREGYLYVTVGGRDMWDAPRNQPEQEEWLEIQDLSLPKGKTMRLRDDGGIPPDNPFLTTPGALPEIYTYGHRQHQGAALNPWTGEIWSTEHGEMGGSELNVLKRGLNYGWPLATWSLRYDSTYIADPYKEGMEAPIHHWTPSIAPSGLDFVTSDRYPGWKGNVLIASLVKKMLVRSVLDGDRVVHDEFLLEGIGRVRTVKVAPDGYIYLLTEDPGMLVRLIPVG